MTKTLLFYLTLIMWILSSCNSVQHFNKKFDKPIPAKKLQADVRFIQKKITKLHPQLYDYISKKELDYKFDSLTTSLDKPLTRREFYLKLSPVISSIKQGHTRVNVPFKKYTKGEKEKIKNSQGLTPISDLKVEFFDSKLYVIENKSIDSSIRVGTEIISIDSVKPNEIVAKYYNTFASDGFNTTYKKSHFNHNIISYYFIENDLKDSLKVQFNYYGDTLTKTIKRIVTKKEDIKSESDTLKKQKESKIKKHASKYSQLSFVGEDSCTALLKVKEFRMIDYKNYFKKIDSVGATALIIDLRNNPGGYQVSSEKLFSYIIDTSYLYTHPYEVTSRTSILHTRFFVNKSIIGKLFHIAFLPLRIIRYSSKLLFIKKMDNRLFYKPLISNIVKPSKKYGFKNKVYVITDGGSFSASCIISSNLKSYQFATFVGEETGGEYNGTAAGYIPTFKLPHSKIKVNFGLLYVKAIGSTDTIGRGIMPDVEIIPNLEDRINDCDPELDWILNDIQNNQ